jgi:hypothetical protein
LVTQELDNPGFDVSAFLFALDKREMLVSAGYQNCGKFAGRVGKVIHL